jgi:iron(III) transport system substrate-binding protein
MERLTIREMHLWKLVGFTALRRLAATCVAAVFLAAAPPVPAQEKVLNLYTARHYQTDEALYATFTRLTGITINRIEGNEDQLASRIKNEGARSPADVFLTVDAARLAREDAAGLFAPVQSKLLGERIPANLRTDNWFAFSQRARVIFYDKAKVNPADVQNYEDLAAPKFKGKICVRSGGHPYNVSLTAAMIYHLGEGKAEDWVKGLVNNFARPPRGGDTDQLRAVAAGECEVAISNTYYYVRLIRSGKPEDREVVRRLGMVWPNQKTWGTHVNVSGGGMLKHAPNKEAALKFLEYLASDEAQQYFANGNNEWPVAKGVKLNNPDLESLGKFKADEVEVGELAKRIALAQRIHDKLGYR